MEREAWLGLQHPKLRGTSQEALQSSAVRRSREKQGLGLLGPGSDVIPILAFALASRDFI